MKKPAKEPARNQESMWTQLLIPLATLLRGDLLALVHQLGLQAITGMLEAERTKLCGERYKHDASRSATRAGSVRGELALGGRRVGLRRPRVAGRDGHEIPLDTWNKLASEDPLDLRALEQMAIGVATRKYERSLEERPGIKTRGTSKSAVSRRFVALTTEKLEEWMSRPLGALDIWTIYIDGIHFGEHIVLCALGVDATGSKHVLGLSSSMAARDFGPPFAASSGSALSCSDVRFTKSVTSSATFPRSATPTFARRCVKHTSVRRSTLPSAS